MVAMSSIVRRLGVISLCELRLKHARLRVANQATELIRAVLTPSGSPLNGVMVHTHGIYAAWALSVALHNEREMGAERAQNENRPNQMGLCSESDSWRCRNHVGFDCAYRKPALTSAGSVTELGALQCDET